LFRFQGKRTDGTSVVYPNYYIRHAGRTFCAETSRLSEAKIKVKKMAGEDAQKRKRLTAPTVEVRVSTLLDLVIEDYKQGGQKTIAHAKGQIENSLRPIFGDMLAAQVDGDEIRSPII